MFNSFCIKSNTVALAMLTAYLVLFGSFPLCYQQYHRVKNSRQLVLCPSEVSDMRLLCYIYFFLLQVESVDSFLQSLGLEKYTVTFQAEEVDMAALLHMTDEDFKAMGIPMGPRKKILLALESKV
uniref:SAM domain-containing protein n=1 Tax=Nicotiana tabacum TaxID=4097 RepID=A0A1S4CPF6_TOBAC|nr:PREDICTED: uncharacterized protein LOC107821069 [Nicotiana tabacum]